MNYSTLNDQDKEKHIKQKYEIEKKSFAIIAKELNTYSNKIRRDAKKFNISIRSRSLAQKNALQQKTSIHPTKGKTRSESTKNKIGKKIISYWDSMNQQELEKRKEQAKQQWKQLTQDEKSNLIKKANIAVRKASKQGSKLEKFLLKELISQNFRVKFHEEQLLSNTKLQIDIFLPQLNVAIEVDGPSHFLPVWGKDTLDRNIKYDKKKTGLLIGKGYILIRIKQQKDFCVTRAHEIFNKLSAELAKIKKKTNKDKIITIED
jgi:very-short-patch-repair endonuclease